MILSQAASATRISLKRQSERLEVLFIPLRVFLFPPRPPRLDTSCCFTNTPRDSLRWKPTPVCSSLPSPPLSPSSPSSSPSTSPNPHSPSPPSLPLAGTLTTKRKDELLAIASSLSLPSALPSSLPRATKWSLAENIRAELKSNPAARNDPRFEGLWSHMSESRMAPSELERHLAGGREVDLTQGQTERVREASADSASVSRRAASPRKSSIQAQSQSQEEREEATRQAEEALLIPSTYREQILEGAPHIFEQLFSPSKHNAHSLVPAAVQELALVPSAATTRSLRRRASTTLRATVKESASIVGEAQERLSSPWVVVIGVILAELGWVIWESVPWVDKVRFCVSSFALPLSLLTLTPLTRIFKTYPSTPSLFLPSVPSFTLHLPVLSVLFHPTFLSALSLWSLGTLLLPLVIATLFAFPSSSGTSSSSASTAGLERGQRLLPASLGGSGRRTASNSNSHSKGSGGIAPPNPLVFTLTRLSLSLLRGFILSPPPAAPTAVLHTLTDALRELVAGGPGALGLQGGRYTFERTVEGYWGVVGVGAAVSSVVVAVYGGRR